MNYGMSGGGSTGLSSFETRARVASGYSGTRRARAATNALGYSPYSEGDMGLGGFDLKKIFGGSSHNVFNQIANVVTAPIRYIVAPVLQSVGLKTLATQVNSGLMSKNLLTSIGQVGQVAGIAALTVIGVGAAGGIGAIGSALGTAAKVVPLATTAMSLGTKSQSAQQGGGQQEQAQQIDAQAFYDAGAADGQNNTAARDVGNSEGQKYYNQGYTDGQAVFASKGQSGSQINAQAFYDQGVADAQSGKVAALQAVKEGQPYYDQGYTDGKKSVANAEAVYKQGMVDAQAGKALSTVSADANTQAIYEKGFTDTLANKQALVSDVTGTAQAQMGNSPTATSGKVTAAATNVVSTAGMFESASVGKIAAIAGSLLVLGLIFSNQNPVLAKRSR